MRHVARDVTQVRKTRAKGRRCAVDPGKREAGDDASRQERKLEARIDERGRPPDQEREGRERNCIEQVDAAEERPREEVERGHQRGAEDWRPVLHDSDVGCEGGDGHKTRGRNRQTQPAAKPKDEYDERSSVQACDHQDVVRGCLLKRGDDVRVNEAAVAQEHGAKHRRSFGGRRKKGVEAREQVAANTREALLERWARAVDQAKQFSAAERADDVDFLAGEITANVGCARIEEIARRPRTEKSFDAVAGAKALRRRRGAWAGIKIGAQAAGDRNDCARNLDIFEIDFVSLAPGKAEWVLAQSPLPAQRLGCVNLTCGEQTRDVIRRHGDAFEARAQAAERDPGDERDAPGCRQARAPGKQRAERNRGDGDAQPYRPRRGIPSGDQDARAEGRGNPQSW
jgi:hypothetical protein